MDVFLWGVLPYLTALIFFGGLVYRYRYDQFGWTTRSSQLYESKILRIASPMFHYALFVVLGGHLMGLFIPKNWTDGVGISQEAYHWTALILGTAAGVATLLGIGMLIYRRRTTGPVFMATTKNDKAMYLVLVGALVLGIWATLTGGTYPDGVTEHNYRQTVSVWFRSLFIFQPNISEMARATIQFKIHILVAFLLFATMPFTRLVHAFTVPLHFFFRPYMVYRSRPTRDESTRTHGRGWDKIGTPDRVKKGDDVYKP